MNGIDGVINIYKEKGYTSHDVVAIVRKMLGRIKTGHTGTLDPAAEGVLPICVGKATKLADYVMAETKGYRTMVNLGVVTDTEDETGNILATNEVRLGLDEIRETVNSFIGEYYQTPPMYSAIKVNGKKLYELAREGKTIERKSRLVNILDIQILDCVDNNKVLIDVTCSKGTYIRTLCKDIGEKLGCGASMGSLLRTFSGRFKLENSVTLAELKRLIDNNDLDKVLIPMQEVLSGYRRVNAVSNADIYLHNGNKLNIEYLAEANTIKPGDELLIFDSSQVLIGIYLAIQVENNIQVRPITMLL